MLGEELPAAQGAEVVNQVEGSPRGVQGRGELAAPAEPAEVCTNGMRVRTMRKPNTMWNSSCRLVHRVPLVRRRKSSLLARCTRS